MYQGKILFVVAWVFYLYAEVADHPTAIRQAAIFALGLALWFRIGMVQRRIETDYEDGEG